MTGSLLGRGRGGRLAVYAGCGAVVVLLVFAYRAAVTEMTRLRELHEQCMIHQESLQQRLQVIFDYKVRLEKTLAEEESANAAVKQELQQRATREKTQRDKDGVEATQRYNSLQQSYKILETEHKDLKEEFEKRQSEALDNTTRLETTVQGLRAELKQARDDKIRSMENLKSKYLNTDNEKTRIENLYNELLRSNGDHDVVNQRLQKQVFQLTRELEEARKTSRANPAALSASSPSGVSGNSGALGNNINNHRPGEGESSGRQGAAGSQNSINLARPPSEQQSTSTTMPRVLTTRGADGIPKAVTKASTQSAEKIYAERPKVKLPVGVLPIPKMFEAEKKPLATEFKKENGAGDTAAAPVPGKDKLLPIPHEQNLPDPPRVPPIGRHLGEQPLPRQEGWIWQHQVPPGVQEVGEEPNNLEKIPELEDTDNHQVGDGVDFGQQYDGGDYDKEVPMKNNDLHIAEGEDEGEDEDDQMEYEGNNEKAEKHPE